jgi:peptidoglycan/LPS O-acetylase OafA/YrhL
MKENTIERLPDLPQLTSLRFFAAFAIVVLHYRDLLGTLPEGLLKLIVGGQYGVTFFFILSGFILTYNYTPWFTSDIQERKFWKFQRYRFAKIYPIYLLGLLLDSPWQWTARLQSGEMANKGHEYWAAWVVNVFGLQSWTPGIPFTLIWNTPSWSVSSEFFFYLTFPFICYFLAYKARSTTFLMACLAVLLVGSTSVYAIVVHWIYTGFDLSWDVRYSIQHYHPLLRLPEFIAGCIAGQFFLQNRNTSSGIQALFFGSEMRRNMMLIVCLALVLWRVLTPQYTGASHAVWLIDNAMKFSIFILPFMAMILAIASGKNFLSAFLALPFLVLLGEASYTLYITHWMGQSLMQLGFMGAYKTPAMGVVFMILSVALSVFLFKYFETPMRLKLRGKSIHALA